MKLKELLSELDLISVKKEKSFDLEIRGISCDSRRVSEGYLYVAVEGNLFDGHNFIPEAIKKGARAIIVQNSKFKIQNSKIPIFIVKDTRIALAKLAAKFYRTQKSSLKFIGITGTNGKTTVSYLIESILRRSRFRVGVIGTINYRLNGKEISSAINTTPSPLELHLLLSEMARENADFVVMEVSSHALDQERVYGIDFNYAVYTNLSQDHLDYHKNLKDYFLAKAKLFEGLRPDSFAIINSDDRFSKELKKKTRAKIFTYGIESLSDIRAENIKWDLEGLRFNVKAKEFDFQIKSKLIGYYNVYNILAAVSTALNLGIDIQIIKSAIGNLRDIPGRLERIDSERNFKVFVDYAHTPEAIKNVLFTLKNFKRRLICVFGCGGQRDREKRPKMGKIVSELSDYFIITNDNPRNEDPREIISDILKGVKTKNFEIILDRREAIRKALSLASEGDIVAILGKGHERYQIIEDKKIPFDDREVVKECLMSR
jgi:UDP-N-acetylmuramoyl-L-alanyl-D-glutamate--2,6-diaminopimelate ligase